MFLEPFEEGRFHIENGSRGVAGAGANAFEGVVQQGACSGIVRL